jgi:hypothetical protein
VKYDKNMKVVNTEHLKKGCGLRYLEVIDGEMGALIGVAWHRLPICAEGRFLIDFGTTSTDR